jgi:hypothetical protein
MKAAFFSFFLAGGLIALTGCGTANVTVSQSYTAAPAARPAMIYVDDFELDVTNIHQEAGLLPNLEPVHPIHRILFGADEDPNTSPAGLVNYMAESIVSDLQDKGFPAQRLAPGQLLPSDGWLVRGVFAQVDKGNRLRRAIIGFGAGKTDLQVVTTVDNLADGPPEPLYQVQTDATSGQAPGAAPFIVLNPASVAVKFAMAGNDIKRNAKNTAAKIASQVAQQCQPSK